MTAIDDTTFESARAMGTTATVVVHGGSLDAADLLAEIDRLERCWSRFLPTSELSAMNAAAGNVTVVSPTLLTLVEHLRSAMAFTGGRFDPTLGAQLAALGYDRTYRELAADTGAPPRGAIGPASQGRLGGGSASFDVLPAASAVRLDLGIALDPGGLGKGLAGDLVTAMAVAGGADGVLVDLGGDVVTRGVAPDGGPWRIEVPATSAHPRQVVELNDGAVATTATDARTWVRSGRRLGHLLDPATGLSYDGTVRATAVAGAGWWAEAAATAAVVSAIRGDDWRDTATTGGALSALWVSGHESVDA